MSKVGVVSADLLHWDCFLSLGGKACWCPKSGYSAGLQPMLAADVAGHSRLVAKDKVGTLTEFKELRATFIDPTC